MQEIGPHVLRWALLIGGVWALAGSRLYPLAWALVLLALLYKMDHGAADEIRHFAQFLSGKVA